MSSMKVSPRIVNGILEKNLQESDDVATRYAQRSWSPANQRLMIKLEGVTAAVARHYQAAGQRLVYREGRWRFHSETGPWRPLDKQEMRDLSALVDRLCRSLRLPKAWAVPHLRCELYARPPGVGPFETRRTSTINSDKKAA